MDFKKIPIIGDIDFNDPDKRKSSIRICAAGALLFLCLILAVIRNSQSSAAQPQQQAETNATYESVDIPMGQDRDRLDGKTIRNVSQQRHGRAGAFAENLFSEDIADKDPLAALSGKTEEDATTKDVLNSADNLPSFMRDNQNVYPERKEPAKEPEKVKEKEPEAPTKTVNDSEARRRRIYEQYGIDPDTGQPINRAGGQGQTATAGPSFMQGQGSGQAAQHATSQPQAKPAEPEQKEESVIEPVKVQVRRSGGVSSFGSSGTELSNLSEQDEFVPDDPRHPFKVKFAYDEKVSSGQRVTIRLCEDMVVDGVLIPVNTHLFATCTVGERLKLNISSIDINGKIYTLNYTAYDNDGAEGLYCPQSETSQVVKQIGEEAGQIAQSAVQSAITGYPGRIFQSGAQVVRSKSGKVTVTVTAGYTFYLMKSL